MGFINVFLVENFPAIVKKINLDERVSDLEVNFDKITWETELYCNLFQINNSNKKFLGLCINK